MQFTPQEGISISFNGRDILFHGTLLLVLADTVAAHQIGGFKVGVSFALRKCRDCFATRETLSSKVYTYFNVVLHIA